jgi:hypothetical protein
MAWGSWQGDMLYFGHMTKQRMWGSLLGSLAAIAVSIGIAPMIAGATEGHDHSAMMMGTTGTTSAKEDVVTNSTDTALQRQAKLERTWTVYRKADSTQLWAISPVGAVTNGSTSGTMSFQKREIKTLEFFSAFDANYLVKLASGEWLDTIPEGAPITTIEGLKFTDFVKRPFPCRLFRTSDKPTVWLACHNFRRAVIREGVFHQFGWEFRDVEIVSDSEVAMYTEETPVTEETVFDEEVGVETTENRMLTEQVEKRLELRGKTMNRDRLIKSPGDPRIFILDHDGERRYVKDMDAVRRHGLDLKGVTEISQDELEAITEGEPVTETTNHAELTQ